ncbi:MAG: dihydropteroate synthase [Methanocellales archaeon]|nr:dihydropteroate synthase [Methanocellales archaeon]
MKTSDEIVSMKIGDSCPPKIMGVINLSEESFYKGSIVSGDEVGKRASTMVEEGADMIDVGARSTAPGVRQISVQEEKERLLTALKDVVDLGVPISVDTQYSDIAEMALNMGACMINDISGLKKDPRMADVLSDFDVPAILMASKVKPGDRLTFPDIVASLVDSITLAERKGISKIIIDPGIGRWVKEKTYEYNLAIISGLERLLVLGKPVLVAISRKSFIGDVLGIAEPSDRLAGTLACTAIAVYKGAHIVRTHDIKETRDIIRMATAIRGKQIMTDNGDYRVIKIDYLKNPEDSVELMRSIDVTETGTKIMGEKTVSRVMLIKNVTAPEALILKQELLAWGGDPAIPMGVMSGEIKRADIVVIGTILQINDLIKKLKTQSFNLPLISNLIRDTLEKDGDVKYLYR